MMLFLISALRAIVEMLGLCLIAQAVLYLLSGASREKNHIYQLFALITRAPRHLVAKLLPDRLGAPAISLVCFITLFLIWIGLAVVRKFL
jgi:hypothetical protein